MFSRRTQWIRTPNRLTEVQAQRRRDGRGTLDLTESNPTRAGLPDVDDLLVRAFAQPGLGGYAPDPFGLASARDAVATLYARKGITVRPDRVLVTASTSEAYTYLFKLLCDPGDVVRVPAPSYPLFEFLADVESVQTRPYALRWDGRWHVDRGALSHESMDRTRALITVNPNNPTGHYLGDDASWLAHHCASHDMALISDEVFLDYTLAPAHGSEKPVRRSVLESRTDAPALTVALGGLSKSLGLPGLKLGWMVLTGPDGLVDEALARLELIADTFLSVGTPVQRALPELVRNLQRFQGPIHERVLRNHRALNDSWPHDRPWRLRPVEAGWYQVLEVPAIASEDDLVCELLESEDVLVQPGYFYDFAREGHLVISLLPAPDVFDAAVERLSRYLERRFSAS